MVLITGFGMFLFQLLCIGDLQQQEIYDYEDTVHLKHNLDFVKAIQAYENFGLTDIMAFRHN